MFHTYHYEREFYPSHSRIPLDVRMKLDLTGIKITLADWLAFAFEERLALCHLPVDEDAEKHAFVAYVDFLSRRHRGQAVEAAPSLNPDLWSPSNVPKPVAQRSAACFNTVMLAEWQRWRPHQRYALFKTAISKSQPEAFADILNELRSASKSATGS
jgi:hypothetical protein